MSRQLERYTIVLWILILMTLSSCCKTIKKQLVQAENENRDLKIAMTRVEKKLEEKDIVLDSLKENQVDVQYPIADQYLKCFIYVINNTKRLGVLRPIVEVDHEISTLWDYLPGLLFDENISGLDIGVDSLVYAKLKIVNDVPFGYDIQRNRPLQTLILNSSTSINGIRDHIQLDFHNTIEGANHTPRNQHRHGHLWRSSIVPSPDIGLDVILLTQSTLSQPDRRNSLNDYQSSEIDTFFIYRSLINRINFTSNQKYYLIHEALDDGLSRDNFNVITKVDTVHRHDQHPKQYHLKPH